MEKEGAFPQWDPDDAYRSLVALYQWTVDNAERQVAWYERKRKSRRRPSQLLLVLAVLLGGIGALCPLLDAACKDCGFALLDCWVSFLELGYILIALAGLAILFDRIFGFSTGWTRYMKTKLELEQVLNEFRFQWAKIMAREVPDEKKGEQRQELIETLRAFTDKVESLVMLETMSWIEEFRKSLTELDKLAERQNK